MLALAVACSTSRHSEQHTSLAGEVQEKAASQEEVQIKREEGPEVITTTVEEWEVPEKAAGADRFAPVAPAGVIAQATQHKPPEGQTMPSASILVKRTTTVDQRGPVLQNTSLNAHTALEAHAQTKVDAEATSASKSAPSAGCAFGVGVWGLAALALLGLLAFLYFRKLLP